MKKIILLIVAPLFLTLSLYAQQDIAGPLPCYSNYAAVGVRNPEKLAKRLTEKLESDSEKVCAIYGWITSHIKYDIDKAAAYDFKRNSAEMVLKKRKAICLGYSDLFNTLCKYSDITSVGVIGYVKNGGYDQGDSFFYSHHIWNAVLVDGEWRLCDATWDAGYIEAVRRTWKGKLIYIFTLGRKNYYYFKPRFRQKPGSAYFLKTGNYFSYDHLPAQPMWQLMDTLITMKQWEQDSACYYGKRKPENYGLSDQYDNERRAFANKNDRDQFIQAGYESFAFQKRNYVDMGLSYTLNGIKHLETINTGEEADTATEGPLCRLIASYCDSALTCYDSTMVMFMREKNMLLAKTKLKKKICTKENKSLLKSAKLSAKQVRGSMYNLNNAVTAINAYEQNSFTSYHTIAKFNFNKVPWSPSSREKEAKIKQLDSAIKILDDSIKNLRQRMEKAQLVLLRAWDDNEINAENLYENNVWAADIITRNTRGRMFSGWDDLDYVYRRAKDSVIRFKAGYDSLAIYKEAYLSDSVAILFKQFTKMSKLTHKYFQKKHALLLKIKTYSTPESDVTERYKDFLEDYSDFRKEEYEWTRQWQKPVNKMAQNYKETYYSIAAVQAGYLKYETKLEGKFQKGRTEFINKEIKGLKKTMKENAKVAKTTKKQALKHAKQVAKNQSKK